MSAFTVSQLEQLRPRLVPLATEWTASQGQSLSTVAGGLDFLRDMADREDFWAILSDSGSAAPDASDLQALRERFSRSPAKGTVAVEERLDFLGLSESEVAALLKGLCEPEGVPEAIRDAFSASTPEAVARALEGVLDTDPAVLTTLRFLGRFGEFQGLPRVLSAALGVALLLVGTGCNPNNAPSSPEATHSAPVPAPSPSAETSPSSTPSSRGEPAPSPAPSPSPTPTPSPSPKQVPKPPRRPPSGSAPVPVYKGISPRRHGRKVSASPDSKDGRSVPS